MESLARTANRGSVSTGYDIDNSLKIEADNQEELLRTPSSAGNRQTWTVSMWFKFTELGIYQMLFGSSDTYMYLGNDDKMYINYRGAGTNFFLATNRVFRDTAAFYHFVVVCDATNGTAADRGRFYVNGVRETDYQLNTYQNMDSGDSTHWNNTVAQSIGGQNGSTTFQSCGYMAEVHSVDGSALTSDSFGEFDSDTGIWIPKEYSGSYGTNGFYLDFADASDLGDDESGNGNDFAETNLTAADQATDTPTNNFCTWLSDGTFFNGTNDSVTTKEGGTVIKRNVNTQWITAHATQAVNNGKWYYEAKVIAQKNCMIGASPVDAIIGATNSASYLGQGTDGTIGFQFSDGNLFYHTGYTNYVSGGLSTDDIVGFALDMDNNKCYVSVNGTYVNSADPANGTNGFSILDKEYIFATATYAPNQEYPFNIGGYTTNTPSSAASDANGYGTFEYAPPTGYYALCTKNLAEYG